jgi:phosphoribosylaminoimidazolecarboxamide formyltransferase/IMP cyclohydrolase
MTDQKRIAKALISVSDKAGVLEFAKVLQEFDVQIISTGGTASALRAAGVEVTDVSDVTGFPEMMDGRVKTLHPKIHGAFLALRDNEEHLSAMNEHAIEPIDLVVVNLYPFEETISKDGVSLEKAVENIDIGGPAMIRSASKNWRDVTVVTDPKLYEGIIEELKSNNGSISLKTRQRLAALAYTRTASYDLAISSYLARQLSDKDLEFLEPYNPLSGLMFFEAEEESETSSDYSFPTELAIELAKVADLRYGENPHQNAALYTSEVSNGIATAEQLHGKEMSFNNYVDADAAWQLVNDLDEQAVAIIKHTNPSGVGVGSTNFEAYKRALSTDPISAFGGIVAFNRTVDADVANAVIKVFSEVIIAPGYNQAAVEIFRSKKNLRVLKVATGKMSGSEVLLQYKQISGGFLVQDEDAQSLVANELKIVTERKPTAAEKRAMRFAWQVCKHVKSNAIVLANETQTLGVGAGQMNRVDSVRIAAMRAERFDLPIKGAALASDAFFPFRDNVDEAAKLRISAIIQPGGSIKDEESIAAANEHGITMAFTGIRHFKH